MKKIIIALLLIQFSLLMKANDSDANVKQKANEKELSSGQKIKEKDNVVEICWHPWGCS